MFPSSISCNEKRKTWEGNHFSIKYGGSKIEMDLSSILADAPTSIGVSVCQ
jgi:hypothetical protein